MIADLLLAFGCVVAAAGQAPASAPTSVPVPAPAPASERLAEVVVHGNHTTPDADVIALAGLTVGAPLAADAIAGATKRLEKADRFEAVDIRKRYRSIERVDEVVLVILIDERPHPMDVPAPPMLKPFRKLRDGLMFLPLVSFADGYGLSYGAQFAFAGVLGKRSRIGVPLTWGAERRAAVEIERKFARGPVSRLEGGAGIVRREHPFFEVPDRRGEVWARAERALPLALRVGGGVRWSDIAFAGASTPALAVDDRMTASGIDLTLDTRIDPTFPRNAVYARAAWEHLDFEAQPARNRTTLEGRGYLGLLGSSVLALRAMHGRADGSLPLYEQWLLGGPASVRGFRTGSVVGDRITSASIELRMPFSSPLRVAKTGVAVFVDRGAVWSHDQRLADADWKQGYGAGVFAIATVFQFRLDVAHGQGRGTRAHVSAGLSF
ncbi:MAG: BamA/TamA family outer membrane protein [Vicinamibacteraceae bacterium]